jgi:hypothetical protein
MALGIALVAAQPDVMLIVLAYSYLASGLIGFAWTRYRRSDVDPPEDAGHEDGEDDAH